MRVRHRGFALAIVLVAVIGVFALAMQSAVMSRSATIEARVLAERTQGERAAASAATLVLLALTGNDVSGPPGGGATDGAFGSDGSQGGGGSGGDEKPRFELPPIVRGLLGDKADEIEGRARDEADQQSGSGGQTPRSADGGGITGRVRRGAREAPEAGFILPSGPIDVPLGDSASSEQGLRCRVWLTDATGGLNVNSASEEELQRYFSAKIADPLAAMSIIDQLLDWRDEDDFIRPRGAETSAYERAGVVCRNGPLSSREELLFLPSMTREIFDAIRDDISLDGDDHVHVGSASREVLAALPGMTPDVVDSILKLRAAGDLTEESLEAALPLFAREAKDRMRIRSSSILRLRVLVQREPNDPGFTYEGLAVAGERGIRALGLKPL